MAEGTSTKSYDGVYKAAVFKLLKKKKKLEKHCIWSGIVYSDRNGKSNMNGEKVQMVRWACWSPLSSTDHNNISQIWKITCYV